MYNKKQLLKRASLMLALTLLLLGHKGMAQTKLSSNELGFKLSGAISSVAEIAYSRILNNNSSIGVSVGLLTISDNYYFDFSLTPNYRIYFGKKRASGFFLEANNTIQIINNPGQPDISGHKLFYGLGVAAGYKFISQKGWIVNLAVGEGKNFTNTFYVDTTYPIFEITLGKRFLEF